MKLGIPHIVAGIGGLATFYAIVQDLTTAATPELARSLVIGALASAVVAIACAAWLWFRNKGGLRWVGLAFGGMSIFVLADSTIRLIALMSLT
ncbi:putative membrane protein [Asticcacaulis biprosthecium C19]|uniref:Putative membrane protein n=2 Tax=Asticcacaulis biprosthecium TaxID=76891 RepID=F4QKI9_9CAUL|nr:putative membrane protein [Asticcacaulis biprosthecium C19]